MAIAKFTTEPFTCPSCVKKIEGAVGRMPGVSDVSVMFNSNKVKVTFDETQVGEGNIAKTITDLGYPVTSKHPQPAA